jgi:hypothetical protein
MEGAMPEPDAQHADYPTVDFILGAISDWINKYRSLTALRDEFRRCSADEVMQIAKDLRVPVDELRSIAAKGPGAAALLEKMLIALSVDPETLANSQPATMRDLQRLCVNCSHKRRCERELAAGTAAENFHAYCPNAFTLDALFTKTANEPSSHH